METSSLFLNNRSKTTSGLDFRPSSIKDSKLSSSTTTATKLISHILTSGNRIETSTTMNTFFKSSITEASIKHHKQFISNSSMSRLNASLMSSTTGSYSFSSFLTSKLVTNTKLAITEVLSSGLVTNTTTSTINGSLVAATSSSIDCSSNNYECQRTSIYIPIELNSLRASSTHYFGYPLIQTTSCYGSKLELRCALGQQFIHIYAAYYGSQQAMPNHCTGYEVDVVCYRTASCDYVIASCQNRSSCDLVVNERVLGNPCPDLVGNQLVVQYECLDPHVFGQISATCGNNVNTRQLEPNCPSINSTLLSLQVDLYYY